MSSLPRAYPWGSAGVWRVPGGLLALQQQQQDIESLFFKRKSSFFPVFPPPRPAAAHPSVAGFHGINEDDGCALDVSFQLGWGLEQSGLVEMSLPVALNDLERSLPPQTIPCFSDPPWGD